MPGGEIRMEAMEVATSNLNGKAMANKLAEVMVNPCDEKGPEPISHMMKSPY